MPTYRIHFPNASDPVLVKGVVFESTHLSRVSRALTVVEPFGLRYGGLTSTLAGVVDVCFTKSGNPFPWGTINLEAR